MKKIELEELKKMTLREVQTTAFNILKDVAKFCDENNIRYYLAYGTLIGAVRHKGFIPWDDDIDIVMPRPDYERFESLYSINKYTLSSINNNRYHNAPFIRIFNKNTVVLDKGIRAKYNFPGIWIDIFPIDGLPNDINKSKRFYKKQISLHRIRWLSYSKISKGRNLFRTICKIPLMLLCRIFSPYRISKIINNNIQKYKFEDSKFVGASACGAHCGKERIAKKIYIDQIEVEFEGEMFKAPKCYHEYLTNIYGDYMTPLPPKNQEQYHNFEAYWKDK